jgi:DNA-binding FadR family transcriptional regulator
VERVAEAIVEAMVIGDLAAARAAIREVAAAAKERIAPFDPSLKWGDFAQWLEREASR